MIVLQSKEILDIKKLIKKLSSNGIKSLVSSTPKESLASHLSSIYAITSSSPQPEINSPAHNTPKSMRNGSHIAIDLSECKSDNMKKPFSEIRMILQSSIKRNPGTENIKIVGMNKDARRDHCYHMMFENKEAESSARIHDQWIKLHFPQARMQPPISYPIKVNRARATAILDLLTGRVSDNAKETVSDSNNGLKVIRVGWLSRAGTGKLYGSMVVCLAEKKDADLLISKGLIEIGGETAYTEAFQDLSSDKIRCFNCQDYGHKASNCSKIPICGNCSLPGHSHRNCRET